jgi:prephenate dehydrogenase
MIDKICIIGVGLIGGSFAAGLKQSNQVQTIVGFGRHEDSLIKAKSLGVIDEYSLDIAIALQNVDMVLIATPVDSFGAILELIKPHVTDAVIISDVGSTKGSVIDIAKQVFGKVPTRFIPAHPIAGKEKSGVEASDGALFDNKRVILTPEDNADTQAIEAVSGLWQTLGARVETMTHQKPAA